MARYRPVLVDIWACDDKFQDYSTLGKLLFIYLITNSHLNESGIYRITYKTISNETEISKDEVKRLINEELLNNVSYDEENNVIFVHKFLKYNGSGNPKLIQKSIDRDRRLIKTTLWKGFDKYYTKDLKLFENSSENHPAISISNSKDNSKKEYIHKIIEHWNSKGIKNLEDRESKIHKKTTSKILSVLKDYNTKEIIGAIDNYSDVLTGDQYFFSYKWQLWEFLDRGIVNFLSKNKPLENYRKEKVKPKSYASDSWIPPEERK